MRSRAYLVHKAEHEEVDFARETIEAALRNYWRPRSAGLTTDS